MLKNRLKELRARDGLNQTELAKLAGVSRQTISLLERDEYTPSVVIALKISQIFNEPVESVFRIEEDEEYRTYQGVEHWDLDTSYLDPLKEFLEDLLK